MDRPSTRARTLGDLISLAQRRAARPAAAAPPARPRASFFFDLASPWTYLAAERVDRLFGGVRWRPASGEAMARRPWVVDTARRAVERRAAELRMPLVWPEGGSVAARGATRVAVLAAERGRGAAFVLAAGRLAFCGGYDI